MARRKLSVFGQPGERHTPDNTGGELDLSGKVSPVGVGLTEGETAILDTWAEELGKPITRHALLKLAVRLFIQGVNNGNIRLEDYIQREIKNRLTLP